MGRTINLTRISEGNHLEDVMKLPYNYDEHIADRCLVKRFYFEQRQLAERTLAEKFKEVNEGILESIDGFVEKCLGIRGQHLFSGSEAESIFGSVLNLDMQISDHEPTFNLIESNLKKYKYLHVTRLKVDSIRKRTVLDVLESSKQSKRVFIMVEQAETLNRSLTGIMMGYLKGRIADVFSPTAVIMLLFCVSSNTQDLPFNHVNFFGRLDNIYKDKNAESQRILEELLRSRGIRMKLGSKPLNYIYHYFTNVDASIASVVYMYNHALFEYYHELENSYEDMDESTRARHFGPDTTKDEHQYLCDQMYYYTMLLHEKDLYPEYVTDIYDDLATFDNLTESTNFFEAVNRLRKIPQEALLRRMDNVIDYSKQNQTLKNGDVDVISILSLYRDKIHNNKDCDTILKELINDLLNHAQSLNNPIKNNKYGIYFTDNNRLAESTLTAVRCGEYFLQSFCQDKTYFQILMQRHILISPGQIDIYDLANEALEEFKELIRDERSLSLRRGPRTKFTPRKRVGSQMKETDSKIAFTQKRLSPEEVDGLAKALFIDVIDCMELQYLIKLDPRTRNQHLKRFSWPRLS